MNKILIIEDEKIKIEKLKLFLKEYELVFRESFQSGMLELKNNFNSYSLLILDMTIPLWEKGKNDLGGNYEQFGGEKILREMKRKKLLLPTVLFTMFDIFPTKDGNISFNKVNELFRADFSDFYLGGVLYNAEEDNWKHNLSSLISKLNP